MSLTSAKLKIWFDYYHISQCSHHSGGSVRSHDKKIINFGLKLFETQMFRIAFTDTYQSKNTYYKPNNVSTAKSTINLPIILV